MSRRASLRALGALALFAAASPANAAEYRRIKLTDGRSIIAEVTDMTAEGLILRVPQGLTQIDPSTVVTLDPVDPSVYQAQPDLVVLIAPISAPAGAETARDSAQRGIQAQLAQIPALQVRTAGDLTRTLTKDELDHLAACGANPGCALTIAAKAGVDLVIVGQVEPTPMGVRLQFGSIWPVAPTARQMLDFQLPDAPETWPEPMTQAAYSLLSLTGPDGERTPSAAVVTVAPTPAPAPVVKPTPAPAPAPAPPPASKPPAAVASVDARARKMAWVPLPGAPSLVRSDMKGFATSMAIAVPGTLAMANIAGRGATTGLEFGLITVGSYYGLTVAVNKAVGLRGLSATATPLPGGGAALTVSSGRPVAANQ